MTTAAMGNGTAARNDEHDGRAAVARELRRTVGAIQRGTQRWLHQRSGTSLSPVETHLLGHLQTEGPQRMSALAALQDVDSSTMTMQIKGLLRQGLVQRHADPSDRRAAIVELTEEGRAALEEYSSRASGILEESLADWSDEELLRFSGDLGRFASDLADAFERATASRE